MIKEDEYGTYGTVYQCPVCKKDHGDSCHHITEQLPILCDECLNNDATDVNLRFRTLIYYVRGLQGSAEALDHRTSCMRLIR